MVAGAVACAKSAAEPSHRHLAMGRIYGVLWNQAAPGRSGHVRLSAGAAFWEELRTALSAFELRSRCVSAREHVCQMRWRISHRRNTAPTDASKTADSTSKGPFRWAAAKATSGPNARSDCQSIVCRRRSVQRRGSLADMVRGTVGRVRYRSG